jgi:hypothetical protein
LRIDVSSEPSVPRLINVGVRARVYVAIFIPL